MIVSFDAKPTTSVYPLISSLVRSEVVFLQPALLPTLNTTGVCTSVAPSIRISSEAASSPPAPSVTVYSKFSLSLSPSFRSWTASSVLSSAYV